MPTSIAAACADGNNKPGFWMEDIASQLAASIPTRAMAEKISSAVTRFARRAVTIMRRHHRGQRCSEAFGGRTGESADISCRDTTALLQVCKAFSSKRAKSG
ncbi:MAG TPA: hypothetical protein VL100_06520 [Croceibacterium sp.]|nr:hypothetical protein [Croceibacterium sp.]